MLWPYPRWVAHRGAGKLAPENTLAAFRLGASYGYRMFECDVKLSQDGVPFLMHDAELARTTNSGQKFGADAGKLGADHNWAALSQLDAGGWHSRTYAGEPLASFEAIARYVIHNNFCLNIEIKPTPGDERRTGELVAAGAARLWQGQAVPPLLTSFKPESLAGAKAAAPHLPRGFLLETMVDDWLDIARQLGCVAIVCNHRLWDDTSTRAAQAAGFKTLSYTVNDEATAERLLALGLDGIITDRVDLFSPAA